MPPSSILLFVIALVVLILAIRGWKMSGSPTAIISGGIGAVLIALAAVIEWQGIRTPPAFLLPLAVSVSFAARGFVARKKLAARPELRPVVSLIMTIAIIALIAALIPVLL